MSVEIGKIQKMTSPNLFCLITSSGETNNTNIMALSWWTYVSNHPATVAIFVSQRSYSKELIGITGEFGLCLPDKSIREEALECGKCSGRIRNKAAEFGIELMEASIIKTKLIKKSRVAMECKVIQEMDTQDHHMFLAEVVNAYIQPEYAHLYAYSGYGDLGIPGYEKN